MVWTLFYITQLTEVLSALYHASIPSSIHSTSEILTLCEQLSVKSEVSSVIKLVVLGNGQIGKSTLVHSLKHCCKQILEANNIILIFFLMSLLTCVLFEQRLFYTFSSDHPSKFVTSSTIGIDYHSIKLDKGEVIIWDFAGQLEYTVTHQYFLSSEAWFSPHTHTPTHKFPPVSYLPRLLWPFWRTTRSTQSNHILVGLPSLSPWLTIIIPILIQLESCPCWNTFWYRQIKPISFDITFGLKMATNVAFSPTSQPSILHLQTQHSFCWSTVGNHQTWGH